jgi:hypothetical protein
MTAFDDDPEYEAQLRDVLGTDQVSAWRDSPHPEIEEIGEYVRGTDDGSEDDVLNDAPSFRRKIPRRRAEGGPRTGDEDDEDVSGGGKDDKILSEDARSISTGDDSPSVQVFCP